MTRMSRVGQGKRSDSSTARRSEGQANTEPQAIREARSGRYFPIQSESEWGRVSASREVGGREQLDFTPPTSANSLFARRQLRRCTEYHRGSVCCRSRVGRHRVRNRGGRGGSKTSRENNNGAEQKAGGVELCYNKRSE